MKPPRFAYARADSLDEALECKHERGADARILAGGQSLVAMLNMRLLTPALLLDITGIASLRHINERAGMLEIGAGVTQQQLLEWPELVSKQPLLHAMLPYVGHQQTRAQGTVCGSIVHADPSSELPLALATLGGEVVLQSRRGQRVVQAGDFQIGLMSTALHDDELVTAVRVPLAQEREIYRFTEVSERHGDFALLAIGVRASPDGIRLGAGGIAEVPLVTELPWEPAAALGARLQALAASVDAADDAHASASARRQWLARLGARLIEECRDALR